MLYNLREYHRPTDIDEAVRLLSRKEVRTVILAGGVDVIGTGDSSVEAVVDLSGLKLDFIERGTHILRLGAMVRLQTIVEELEDVAGGLLSRTAHLMAGWHVRNAATLGGALVAGGVHSPLSVALGALLARVRIYWKAGEAPFWSDLAKQTRLKRLRDQIITAVTLNLPDGITTGYAQVARTPADRPIVCAAAMAYPSGGGEFVTYTAVGGLSRDLVLIGETVKTDDPSAGIETVVSSVIRDNKVKAIYLSDFLGSAEYRRGVAPILARRALTTALNKAGITIHSQA